MTLTVVDDGSTDDTAEVVAAVGDNRVDFVRQSNRGRCAARNVGAERSTSPWLVFLDSDDELLPGALRSFDEAVRATGCDLVVGGTLRIAVNGAVEEHGVDWDADRQLPWAMAAGSFAIRRSLFEQLGGYCERLEFSEHTELVFKMRSLAARPTVALLDSPVVRIHERAGRYDPEVQFRTATHLLEHIGIELADDRSARARFHGIAGVSAAKLGNRSVARAHLAQAFRDQPRPLTAARLARSVIPGRWRITSVAGDRA